MSKVKFSLKASPTFKAPVKIPVAGGDPVTVEFTFKHRTRDDFRDFLAKMKKEKERDDVEVIMDIASAWELEDPFDAKSINELTQHYAGAARAIIETYMAELSGARLGN